MTAKTMIRGALAFAPFFARHLGEPELALPTSIPAVYGVHRESQRSAEDICHYLKVVHALVMEPPRASLALTRQGSENCPEGMVTSGNHNRPLTRPAWTPHYTAEAAINPVELGKKSARTL